METAGWRDGMKNNGGMRDWKITFWTLKDTGCKAHTSYWLKKKKSVQRLLPRLLPEMFDFFLKNLLQTFKTSHENS